MHPIASQRVFISKNFRGSMPPDPPRKLVAFGHSGLLSQTINPRQNPVQGESNSQDCFSLNEVRLELTKAFFIFQMYKYERTDILETHFKGALEEGLFTNLEKFITNRTELIQIALLSFYHDKHSDLYSRTSVRMRQIGKELLWIG